MYDDDDDDGRSEEEHSNNTKLVFSIQRKHVFCICMYTTYICIRTESQSNLLLDEIPKPNNKHIGEREETGYVGFITLFRLSFVFIYFA